MQWHNIFARPCRLNWPKARLSEKCNRESDNKYITLCKYMNKEKYYNKFHINNLDLLLQKKYEIQKS